MGSTNEKSTCQHCGRAFTPSRRGQKYCSHECGEAHFLDGTRPVVEKVCPTCGKRFSTRSSVMKYCSVECQVAHNNGSRYLHGTTKTCAQCGKSFTPHHGKSAFCSDECRRAARAARARAHNAAMRTVFHRICVGCGVAFDTTRSNKKFCCAECEEACHSSRSRVRGESGSECSIERIKKSRVVKLDTGALTEEQMSAVQRDMELPSEQRFARSRKWTPAMRRYAIRIDRERFERTISYN